MSKLDKLKQAEHLYLYKKQPLDMIETKHNLSSRSCFCIYGMDKAPNQFKLRFIAIQNMFKSMFVINSRKMEYNLGCKKCFKSIINQSKRVFS